MILLYKCDCILINYKCIDLQVQPQCDAGRFDFQWGMSVRLVADLILFD